jgi:uncharacterized protein (DUF4415 family)
MTTVRMTLARARTKLTAGEKRRLDALTDEEIDKAARSDPDNPPSTKKELAQMAAIVRKRGRPPMKTSARKIQVALRLSPDVIRYFKAMGPGWQTRIGEALQRVVKRGR